jgi:hypothetical protein
MEIYELDKFSYNVIWYSQGTGIINVKCLLWNFKTETIFPPNKSAELSISFYAYVCLEMLYTILWVSSPYSHSSLIMLRHAVYISNDNKAYICIKSSNDKDSYMCISYYRILQIWIACTLFISHTYVWHEIIWKSATRYHGNVYIELLTSYIGSTNEGWLCYAEASMVVIW